MNTSTVPVILIPVNERHYLEYSVINPTILAGLAVHEHGDYGFSVIVPDHQRICSISEIAPVLGAYLAEALDNGCKWLIMELID